MNNLVQKKDKTIDYHIYCYGSSVEASFAYSGTKKERMGYDLLSFDNRIRRLCVGVKNEYRLIILMFCSLSELEELKTHEDWKKALDSNNTTIDFKGSITKEELNFMLFKNGFNSL